MEVHLISVKRFQATYEYVTRGPSLRGRPTPPATLAQEGNVYHFLCEADRSMIEYVFFYDRI